MLKVIDGDKKEDPTPSTDKRPLTKEELAQERARDNERLLRSIRIQHRRNKKKK